MKKIHHFDPEPREYPYTVILTGVYSSVHAKNEFPAIHKWAAENFGDDVAHRVSKGSIRLHDDGFIDTQYIVFKNEEDAMAFKLRWL